MLKKWKTLSKKYAFYHKWFKVVQETVERDDGVVIDDYFLWEEGDVVLVVAINGEGKLILVKQYKHASGEFMIEFPAGFADEGEDILLAAKRELVEETGFESEDWEKVAVFTNNPTKVRGKIHVYLAKNAVKIKGQSLDENENIEVFEKTVTEVEQMIEKGDIWVTGIIAAFYLVIPKLKI